MSSLLATASLWNDNHSKRRIPTMRKTQKKMPSLETKEVPLEIDNDFIKDRPTTFEEDQETFDDRNSKVTKLIDNMTNVLEENDGSNLENFTPLEPPEIQKLKEQETSLYGRNGEEDIPLLNNELQLQPPKIKNEDSQFGPNVSTLGVSNQPYQTKPFSNYQRIYEPSKLQMPTKYYGNTNLPLQYDDNKLLEKINYMIHMLEQQQNEKTSNITEEFVLYMFLGVFIIFVVDSFAKTGKYIR